MLSLKKLCLNIFFNSIFNEDNTQLIYFKKKFNNDIGVLLNIQNLKNKYINIIKNICIKDYIENNKNLQFKEINKILFIYRLNFLKSIQDFNKVLLKFQDYLLFHYITTEDFVKYYDLEIINKLIIKYNNEYDKLNFSLRHK